FFTGDNSPTPKLGIDLQGGTRVTLTARTPDGNRPSQDSLNEAHQLIENRVSGVGASGSEVGIDGDNLDTPVPGDDSQQARTLATTAKLYIRPVLQAVPAPGSPQAQQRPGQPTAPAVPPAPAPAPETPPAGDGATDVPAQPAPETPAA